jgi:ElaB/YqjD/DUF883 family membrane-anchored ribosome-binding protein
LPGHAKRCRDSFDIFKKGIAMTTSTSSFPSTATASEKSETLAERAARESNRVMQKLRDKTDAVVDSIQPKIDAVSSYARNDPTKAVLIAAATGAALMGLLGLIVRARRPASAGARAMSSIRDAALDLADRAHVAATDAIGAAHQRASVAQQQVDDMQTRAGAVADRVTETWQNLREQAGPVIEKLRPQLDAVASYAKEDPVRAALGVTTVAAVLFGLLSLSRR